MTGPWWTSAKGVGAGLLLAGALGAWQATRVADRLGFGPGSRPAQAAHPKAAASRAREAPVPDAPLTWLAQDSGAPRFLGTSAQPGPGVDGPWSSDIPARDWSRSIAHGVAPPEPEEEQRARLADEFHRLARDLEFTAGLPEPPQQRMAKQPEPWRPDPEAAARPPPVIEGVSPASASADGGTQVIIRGHDLRAAQVMFGSAAARIASVGPDQVTVIVPPTAPGQVRIALTNDDGHFALAPELFTLQPATARERP